MELWPWLSGLVGIALAAGWGGGRLLKACETASEADWRNPWLNRLDGLNRLYCRHYHRLAAEPLSLPPTGPALVAANHLSGLDPLLMIAASPRPLRFLVATEQYHRFGLTWFFRAIGCIPVDRAGRPERAFREARRALERGEVVALFPQGGIQHRHEPPRPLKPGVARLAHLAGCPVYALNLEGIRGEGHVLPALWLRSRARIIISDPLPCHRLSTHDCLEALAKRI